MAGQFLTCADGSVAGSGAHPWKGSVLEAGLVGRLGEHLKLPVSMINPDRSLQT